MDCKQRVKGNTTYFPVQVKGGLVQMGNSELAAPVWINEKGIARLSLIQNCPIEWPVLAP